MIFRNTSGYSDTLVRNLVLFGAKDIDLSQTAVWVKKSKHPYAGVAYPAIPPMSSWLHGSGARYLIVIRVGRPNQFPVNNLRTSIRWLPFETSPQEVQRLLGRTKGTLTDRYVNNGINPATGKMQYGIATTAPYGGVLIECRDWREGIMSVAAHEARHVYQFQNGLLRKGKGRELDAQTFTAQRLADYREISEGYRRALPRAS